MAGVWTTVEVQKVDVRNGHVYLEVAERDAQGNSIAQARAVIWAGTANQIVPDFERATGMVLGARHQAAGARQADRCMRCTA